MPSKLTLVNGDCMDGMRDTPDKYYELAIVDPPYGIGLDMVNKIGAHKRNIHKVKEWNNLIPTAEYFNELYRVSKNQIIWGANYYPGFIQDVGYIVHDKMMSTELTSFNFSHADLASCSLQKRITIFRYEWSGNRQGGSVNWKNDGKDGRIHPTQKPIALYKWLLHNYAKPGDKILDTHLGSGSIAIACYDYGFDLTGYEIDKDYYNAMMKRVNNHIAQGNLFTPPSPPPPIPTLI
jgi:site-specific DNA-methyltransferase (adenine-specific)